MISIGVGIALGLALHASNPPPIEYFELATQGCDGLNSVSLRSLLSVEVGAPMNAVGEVDVDGESVRVLRVFLTCVDLENVAIRLQERVTEFEVTGALTFDAEIGRERRLALAVAELVEESRGAWEKPPPAPAPPVIETAPEPSPPAPAAPPTLRLSLGPELALEPVRPRLNLRVDTHFPVLEGIELSVGTGFSYDETAVASGTLRTTGVSAAAVLWFSTDVKTVRLSGGGGARYGWAWLSGRPDDTNTAAGSTLSDPFGGPLLSGLIEWPMGEGRVGAGLEAGLMTARVQALSFGEEVGGLDIGWISLTLNYRREL
ncbi:MAG: hypothetical protein AAF654_03090 [Myxococcota bacterium]